MESSSVCDENSEETGCSTLGVDSIDYSRTISDVSSFSERSEEHSGPFEMRSRGWPIAKLVDRPLPVLSRLSMKQRADVLKRRPTEDGMANITLVPLFFIALRIEIGAYSDDRQIGRVGTHKGEILKAFAGRRHVRDWQGCLHCCGHLKCHHKPLW